MAYDCQAGARKRDYIGFLTGSGSNVAIDENGITTKRSKEALRDLSLSEWPPSVKGLKFVQVRVLASAYSIFGIAPFYSFHLAKANVLEKCIFTYL